MNFLYWSSGFALGNLILQQLSVLPDFFYLLLLVIISMGVCLITYHYQRYILSAILLGIIIGFSWTWVWASYYVSQQLPEEWIKKNVEVVGQVISIPQVYSHHTAFRFRVEQIIYEGKRYDAPRYLNLSWYEDQYSKTPIPVPELTLGQTWTFTVRLKPPQGFASPFASDHSQHLFSQRVGAVGYIYTKLPVELLAEDIQWIDQINKYREHLSKKMRTVLNNQNQSGIIEALAIGEKGKISTEEWKILQATGTSHLVAISGLHIGLVAGLVLGVMSLAIRSCFIFTRRYPSVMMASFFAWWAAFVYSALAGFAIPTQRALIMLSLAMLMVVQRQAFSRIYTFAAAVVLVLLWDPLATLSVSFWLSFIAVGTLFYLMSGRIFKAQRNRLYDWTLFQLGIGVLLTPATLWFFQQTPLVSPLANAIAIPWVSFIVVPLTLFGCFFIDIFPWLGNTLLQWGNYFMQVIWFLLEFLANVRYATWQYTIPHSWILLLITLGVAILFLPRGFPGRAFGIIALLSLALIEIKRPLMGEVWIDILDVGQGLSTVVRTSKHVLVYDTGDQFSDRLNAGTAVVLPFLRGHAISAIDILMISHADRDHMGGANSILQELAVKKVMAGDQWKSPYSKVTPCLADQHWEWDGVYFQVLHPAAKEQWQGNNASCVLKISVGNHSVLLTGDIESAAEKQLLMLQANVLPSSVLVAPHHGSRTSSTLKFINQVDPEYVIFPAGYLNRFRFPSAKILERYTKQGALALITATHGTIRLAFDALNLKVSEGFRKQYKRYWHRN